MMSDSGEGGGIKILLPEAYLLPLVLARFIMRSATEAAKFWVDKINSLL